MAARWKLRISHYQQYADDMVTPGMYAAAPGGGYFLDTNSGAGLVDPQGELSFWLDVEPIEITGLEKIDLSYRLKTANELANPDGSNYNFALSNQLSIFSGAGNSGAAYNFIRNWLIDDATAPNNSIAAELVKEDCYGNVVIESLNIGLNQITWNSKHCVIDIDLKEIQPRVSCFERTLIDDNHQEWFYRGTGYQHPRFKYCNKISSYVLLIVMSIVNSVFFPFLMLETLINQVIAQLNTIPGVSIAYFTPVSDFIGDIIYKIAGCKYEHSAPLIRTYFQNVCDKCGLTYNGSEDIFNSPTLSYALNDGLDPVYGTDNPYYNTVMFYPVGEIKGMQTGQSVSKWHPSYNPGFTGFSFAEELKRVFNAEWRIYNDEFCFYKKGQGGYINANALVYDFTGADASKLLGQSHEFSWDEQPRFAYMRGVWAENDVLDSNNADTVNSWNSLVDFNKNKNPNFKGEKNNMSDYFAPTQFRFDNTDRDYILDGIVGTFGSVYSNLTPGVQAQVDAILADIPEHAILIERKNVEKARLLIWDPALSGNDDYTNSNSYSANYEIVNWGTDPSPFTNGFTPVPDAGGYTYPVPDPYYNGPIGIYAAGSYTYWHEPNYGTNYYGKYYIYSLPLHFDEKFKYTLYDNFFKEDDPQYLPPMRIRTTLEMTACCADFDTLGLDGSGLVKLNCKVRVPADVNGGYYDMFIYEIKYSAETETIALTLYSNKYN